MNIYGLIALIIGIIIFAHVFEAYEPIRDFLCRITDIPVFDSFGSNPPIFKFAVRLAYLIVVVALVKMIFSKKSG